MRPAPPKIAFAGGTLDRAAHLRTDGGAERLRDAGASRVVLVGRGQEVAVAGNGGGPGLGAGEDRAVAQSAGEDRGLALVPTAAVLADAELTFLGLDASGAGLFAHDATASAPATGQIFEFVSLRGLAGELQPDAAALAAYAVALIGWHRVTRYCGRCGNATVVEAAGHRRRCPVCGLVQFPRTDPAITMLVQSGDRCVLSRRVGAPENRWSALAGFVEPGETPEEAVIREAREETGVEVVAVEYVTSQPWPFPQALMIGFWGFVDPGATGATLTPDPEELVEARWWGRDELDRALRGVAIVLPPPGTIGHYLITTWLAGGSM
jgi:NAD+ diphosphatase